MAGVGAPYLRIRPRTPQDQRKTKTTGTRVTITNNQDYVNYTHMDRIESWLLKPKTQYIVVCTNKAEPKQTLI